MFQKFFLKIKKKKTFYKLKRKIYKHEKQSIFN